MLTDGEDRNVIVLFVSAVNLCAAVAKPPANVPVAMAGREQIATAVCLIRDANTVAAVRWVPSLPGDLLLSHCEYPCLYIRYHW